MDEYIKRETVIRTLGYLLSRVTSRTDYDRIAYIVPNERTRAVARGYELGNEEAQKAVMSIPAADVVEVVRCYECRMYEENKEAHTSHCRRELNYLYVKPDGGCTYGVRKDGIE